MDIMMPHKINKCLIKFLIKLYHPEIPIRFRIPVL